MSGFSSVETAHYRRYFDAFAARPGVLAPLELHALLVHLLLDGGDGWELVF
jgi:hypothetical protein